MGVKLHHIKVSTPDCLLEFQIKHGSTGRQLFTQVCNTLGLREVWYFGLQFTDSKNVKKWVKLNKKISAGKSKEALEFALKVKFYPEEASEELIQDITLQLFYFDVKAKLIHGDVYCPPETALLLASYQSLVRHGCLEADQEKPAIVAESYIPQNVMQQCPYTNEQWTDKISVWHKQHGYMSRPEAMMEYMKIIQDLEMYGVSYFPIKNNRGTPLWLGVDALGLNIYEEDNRLEPKVSFPWSEIRKLAYNHSKFCVKPVAATAKDLVFTCEGTSACKEILALCTGNHELYARRRAPDTIEVQQMKAQAKMAKDARQAERDRLASERRARELMEDRYMKLELAMQEQEMAYEMSKSNLTDYQRQVKELEEQLEAEKAARLALQEMQLRLQAMNDRLERESAASEGERQRLQADRMEVLEQIEQQKTLIENQEQQKLRLERELAIQKMAEQTNGAKANSTGEQELQLLDGLQRPEDDRQVMAATDMDHAKRLEVMRNELNEVRDRSKLQKVDMQYEDNVAKGMDKYRTLHAIRQGNTKKRVEQFEAM